MRKQLILLSLVSGLVGCSNDDVLEKAINKERMDLEQNGLNRRNYAEALEVANSL